MIASNTTAIITAITTRFEVASLDELLTAAGTLAPGVLAGRFTTEGLWKLERVDVEGTAGTTNVDDAFFVVFLADFLTTFLADFFTALFFAGAFFTLFLTAFLAEVLFAVFFAVFFAEVFLAVFLAVFLTATVVLLGLRLKSRINAQ